MLSPLAPAKSKRNARVVSNANSVLAVEQLNPLKTVLMTDFFHTVVAQPMAVLFLLVAIIYYSIFISFAIPYWLIDMFYHEQCQTDFDT